MKAVKTHSHRVESLPPAARVAPHSSRLVSPQHHGVQHTSGLAKLPLSKPSDGYEQEADRVADQVMRMSAPIAEAACGVCAEVRPQVQMQAAPSTNTEAAVDTSAAIRAAQRGGAPLPRDVRAYFEPRFGHDFSAIRVHADGDAAQAARSIGASAYTIGNDIVFGAGTFAPGTAAGGGLIAHELAHVVQQGHSPTAISRKVELRPPGKGEYSAFGRRAELLDRLNAQSSAIQYHLSGRKLECTVIDESKLSAFDQQMRQLLGPDVQVIPMRLITKEGRDREHQGGKVNTTEPYKPVFVDTFVSGYVDLDDLLATDDTSFKLSLIHLLAERAAVPNYARRLGTNFADDEFKEAHRQTRDRDDLAILQNILGDPTLTLKPGTSGVDTSDPDDKRLIFRYKSERDYTVVRIYHHIESDLSTGETFVETLDGTRFTIEDFIASRVATTAP
jgi:hypothetical protein